MTAEDEPFIRERWKPEPKPEEVRFVAKLDLPPLDWPKRAPIDHELAERRTKAEHLCLWLGCSRVLCRRTRHCLGPNATCIFEMPEVDRPLLE